MPFPKSYAWDYFDKLEEKTARCKICLQVYATANNTTNLWKHLLGKHGISKQCSKSVSVGFNIEEEDQVEFAEPIEQYVTEKQIKTLKVEDEIYTVSNLTKEGTTNLWACRSCGVSTEGVTEARPCYDVEDISGHTYSFGQMFDILSGHSIQPNEPSKFCQSCAGLLFKFMEFRLQCQHMTDVYKDMGLMKFVEESEIQDVIELPTEQDEVLKMEIESSEYTEVEYLEEGDVILEEYNQQQNISTDSSRSQTIKTCPFCKKIFYHIKRFLDHVKDYHPMERRTECVYCELKGIDPNYIEIHETECVRERTFKNCDVCNAKIRRSLIKKHMRDVHQEGPNMLYTCDFCGAVRRDKNYMRIHILTHTKPNQCEHCGKAFATSAKLKVHMDRDHEMGEIHQCPMCEYQTRAVVYLRKHLRRKHQGVRPKNWECNECGLRFYGAKNLEDHLRRHSSVKMFACEHCNAKFKTEKSLKTHQNVHQEYKYECPVCKRPFLTNQQLRFHIQKSHKDFKLPPPGTVLRKGYTPIWQKALNKQVFTLENIDMKSEPEIDKEGLEIGKV